MKITAYLSELSEGDEIVFVTVPPLEQEVIDHYNERRKDHPEEELRVANGRLVVPYKLYQLFQGSTPGGHVAAELAGMLEESQKAIDDARTSAEHSRQLRHKNIAKFFGVPGVTKKQLENDKSFEAYNIPSNLQK